MRGRQPLPRGAPPAREDHRGQRRRRGRRTGARAQHPQARRPAGLVRQPAGARDLALPGPRPTGGRRAVRLRDAGARTRGRGRQRAPAVDAVRPVPGAQGLVAQAGPGAGAHAAAAGPAAGSCASCPTWPARYRCSSPATSTAPPTSTGRRRWPRAGPRSRTPSRGRRARRSPTPGSATPTATPTPTRCRTPATPGRREDPRPWTRTSSTASTGCSTRARRRPSPAGWSASVATRRSTCAFAKPFPTDHRGVVSTFDVTPGEAPMLVSPEHRRVFVGDQPLRVRFHGEGTRHEVVALVPRGATSPLLSAVSTGGRTDGVVRLDKSGLRPGRYDVVLIDQRHRRLGRPSAGLGVRRRRRDPGCAPTRRRTTSARASACSWTGAPGPALRLGRAVPLLSDLPGRGLVPGLPLHAHAHRGLGGVRRRHLPRRGHGIVAAATGPLRRPAVRRRQLPRDREVQPVHDHEH